MTISCPFTRFIAYVNVERSPCYSYRIDSGSDAVADLLATVARCDTVGEFQSLSLNRSGNLAVSAWDGKSIVGIAVARTDLRRLTCITDLVVARGRRRLGIARELMRRVYRATGEIRLLLLATPIVEVYDPERRDPGHRWFLRNRPGPALVGRHEPPWLRAIDAILASEYASKLTVAEIARRLRMHRVHISRTFLSLRTESINSALRRRRIDAACRHLMHNDVSLATVALDVGFSEQAQFTRAFRRVTGTTPGHFRSLFRARNMRRLDGALRKLTCDGCVNGA